MELVERRAREANERLKKNKTMSTYEKAKKIEEQKEIKRACTLIQSAYRRRQATARMQLLRSQACYGKTDLILIHIFDRKRPKRANGKAQWSYDAIKIAEEYVWESKRMIRI